MTIFCFFFFETSKASMDAKWIPAITLLLFLRPLLLHPSVTLPLYVINTHRDINIPPFFLNSPFSLTPTGTQVPQPSWLRKVSETFLKLVSEPSQCSVPSEFHSSSTFFFSPLFFFRGDTKCNQGEWEASKFNNGGKWKWNWRLCT